MKQRRLLVSGGSLLILLLIWMFFHQGEDDVLQSHLTTGVITEFHNKSPVNSSASPSKSRGKLTIAVVKLKADGLAESGHARIFVPRNKYSIGTEVPLLLKLYKNGSRKIILAPDSATQAPVVK